jgi:hypothetical protein
MARSINHKAAQYLLFSRLMLLLSVQAQILSSAVLAQIQGSFSEECMSTFRY